MFSEKNSFLIHHPDLDKPLWQNMKQWLDVDMTPPQTAEPEIKKVAEPKPTTYRSLLKRRY
jgi:chromosome partitioning protein